MDLSDDLTNPQGITKTQDQKKAALLPYGLFKSSESSCLFEYCTRCCRSACPMGTLWSRVMLSSLKTAYFDFRLTTSARADWLVEALCALSMSTQLSRTLFRRRWNHSRSFVWRKPMMTIPPIHRTGASWPCRSLDRYTTEYSDARTINWDVIDNLGYWCISWRSLPYIVITLACAVYRVCLPFESRSVHQSTVTVGDWWEV